MGNQKENTYKKIIAASRKEFLSKGFNGASMRVIASEAGITAGGLYRHFDSKASMFNSLVAPSLEAYYKLTEEMTLYSIKLLRDEGREAFVEYAEIANRKTVAFLSAHREAFQLMFLKSAGTSYENTKENMVLHEIKGAKALMGVLKAQEIEVKEYDDSKLYLLYRTVLTPMFELISQGYSLEQIDDFRDITSEVANFGWQLLTKK